MNAFKRLARFVPLPLTLLGLCLAACVTPQTQSRPEASATPVAAVPAVPALPALAPPSPPVAIATPAAMPSTAPVSSASGDRAAHVRPADLVQASPSEPPIALPHAPAAIPAPPSAPAQSPVAHPPPAVDAPASEALYLCKTAAYTTPIEMDPAVTRLCKRHPEMGPCKYHRGECRHAGGRVFNVDGQEITPAVEEQYDAKVLRFKFQS